MILLRKERRVAWIGITALIGFTIWLAFSDKWHENLDQTRLHECRQAKTALQKFHQQHQALAVRLPEKVRPGIFAQTDRQLIEHHQNIRTAWQDLDALHLLEGCQSKSRHAAHAFWQLLIWRRRHAKAQPALQTLQASLHAAEQVLAEAKEKKADIRKRAAAAKARLGRLAIPRQGAETLKKRYELLFALLTQAQQDIQTGNDFRIARADTLINLVTSGIDGIEQSRYGQTLVSRVTMDQLDEALAQYNQAIASLLTEPVPQTWQALKNLQNQLEPVRAQYQEIKTQIATAQKQRTQLDTYCTQLKADASTISRIQESAQKMTETCTQHFGAPDARNAWWQMGWQKGNPQQIARQIHRMASDLFLHCIQDAPKQSALPGILERFSELQVLRNRFREADAALRETYRQYIEEHNWIEDNINHVLRSKLDELETWLQATAPAVLQTQFYHLKHRHTQIQQAFARAQTPADYKTIIASIVNLHNDIETLQNKTIAELREAQDRVRGLIGQFTEAYKAVYQYTRQHPAILPEECGLSGAVLLKRHAEKWEIPANLPALRDYEQNLENGLIQIRAADKKARQIRKDWQKAKKKAEQWHNKLGNLRQRTDSQKKNSQWDLLQYDYQELLEEIDRHDQELQTLRLRPDDVLYCVDATQDLTAACQQIEQFHEKATETLRKLAQQERGYNQQGVDT